MLVLETAGDGPGIQSHLSLLTCCLESILNFDFETPCNLATFTKHFLSTVHMHIKCLLTLVDNL